MSTDFEENRKGRLSIKQQKFLIHQLLLKLVLLGCIGIPVALGLIRSNPQWKEFGITYPTMGWIIFILLLSIIMAMTWSYAYDLYFNHPICQVGTLRKYRRKPLRGQDQYCVQIEIYDRGMLNPELYTTQLVWNELKGNLQYEVFGTKYTRWLLSWQEILD